MRWVRSWVSWNPPELEPKLEANWSKTPAWDARRLRPGLAAARRGAAASSAIDTAQYVQPSPAGPAKTARPPPGLKYACVCFAAKPGGSGCRTTALMCVRPPSFTAPPTAASAPPSSCTFSTPASTIGRNVERSPSAATSSGAAMAACLPPISNATGAPEALAGTAPPPASR
eukprot:scaffold51202_cov65-Phaeocystis_antarctica.AAC.7